ncbi:hypothetical protein AHAS_Ahas09G0109000 [Arachis hypogaea]
MEKQHLAAKKMYKLSHLSYLIDVNLSFLLLSASVSLTVSDKLVVGLLRSPISRAFLALVVTGGSSNSSRTWTLSPLYVLSLPRSQSRAIIAPVDAETEAAGSRLPPRLQQLLGFLRITWSQFGVSGSEFARVKQRVEKDRTQCRRQFFCNKEGKRAEKYISNSNRKREHKALTRTGCEAMLAVYFDTKTSAWRVKKLVEKHNLDLILQCLVHLIQNHRRMTEAQKVQANIMHDNGLPTSKIMGLMVGQVGGYAIVGFTKKDPDNHNERTHREKLIGGNSNTTYRKNKYRRPLVIFSGCNHHRQTCIFGFALIENEQTTTYTWLLQNFLDVMLNKSPSIVVTEVMRQ